MTDVAVAPLTKVQERILAEIRAFQAEHGYAPSLRELSDLSGRGLSSVAYQVRQLEKKGRLRRGNRQARALVLLTVGGRS